MGRGGKGRKGEGGREGEWRPGRQSGQGRTQPLEGHRQQGTRSGGLGRLWAWASSLGARSTGWVLAALRPPAHPPQVCRPRPGDLPLCLRHLCRGVQDWEGDPGPLAQAVACPDRGSDPYCGPLHPHHHRAFPSTAGPGPALHTPAQLPCPHPCSRPPASRAPSHSLACASPPYPRAAGVSRALGGGGLAIRGPGAGLKSEVTGQGRRTGPAQHPPGTSRWWARRSQERSITEPEVTTASLC